MNMFLLLLNNTVIANMINSAFDDSNKLTTTKVTVNIRVNSFFYDNIMDNVLKINQSLTSFLAFSDLRNSETDESTFCWKSSNCLSFSSNSRVNFWFVSRSSVYLKRFSRYIYAYETTWWSTFHVSQKRTQCKYLPSIRRKYGWSLKMLRKRDAEQDQNYSEKNASMSGNPTDTIPRYNMKKNKQTTMFSSETQSR